MAVVALLSLGSSRTSAGEPGPDEGIIGIAAALPSGFAEQTIASGMSSPTAMAFAPDGRLFVAEQTGALRVIKNGALLVTPFVTLSVNSSGERGLLGVAFDPNFTSNNYVYVYYTTSSAPLRNRISRFTANGDVAVGGSEVQILNLDTLSGATNHNGGAIHFGPDGKLYVAVGDNANGANAQALDTLHGKMLRLNKDGTIPTDNPFYGSVSGNDRMIWAYGLRNPFTFAFQPGTGRMFINDVGQSAWEEINDGIAGSNYGWPDTEGATSDPDFRSPIHAYGHSGAVNGCAITGGAFYNPPTTQFPSTYTGKYFFADYCSSWIRTYDPATNTAAAFATDAGSPVDLQVSSDGSLYYLYRSGGGVRRVYYTASQAPAITQHPANTTVTAGQPASFSCAATGPATITYQWQRNSSNISGATSTTYTIPATVTGDNGATFRCRATNSFGTATSNSATLTVTANTAPTASITAPTAGTTYAAGTTINFSGTGTDTQDGTLPAAAFTWQVDFHHDSHTHPFVAATTGSKTGSFVIPTSGETATNVWYRIYLTVRDSGNMTHVVQRDIVPRVSQITVGTNRSGLQVTVDGQPFTAPYTFNSVHGMQRSIGTTSPQTYAFVPWAFQSWSDGGSQTHTITTPASSAVYVATFKPEIGASPAEPPGVAIPEPAAGGDTSDRRVPSGDVRDEPGAAPEASPPEVGLPPIAGPEASASVAIPSPLPRLVSAWRARIAMTPPRLWFDHTRSAALSRAFWMFGLSR